MFTLPRFDPPAFPPRDPLGRRMGTRVVPPTTTTILLGVAFSALVVTPTAVAAVVVVASVATLALEGGRPASVSRPPASTAFARTAATVLAAVVVTFVDAPLGARSMLIVAQFAFVLLIASMYVRVPPSRAGVDDLHRGVLSAAAAAGLFAIVQVSVLGNPRAEGATTNAIVFGDLALVLAIMALALHPTDGTPIRRRNIEVTLGAAGLGFVAAIASGTRGVIVATPVLLGILLACRPELRPRPSRRVSGVAAIGVGVLAVALAQGVLVRRLSTVAHDVTTYLGAAPTDAAAETSIGARFEAWRATLSAFWHDPISGVGWGNLGRLFDAQVAAGQRNQRIATFEHAHQQLLGSLGSGGILGAAVMVAMVVVPALWFARAVRRGDGPDRRAGSAGLVVTAGFAVFGLTESIFESFAPVAFYALAVGALMASIRPEQWVRGRDAGSDGLGGGQIAAPQTL